MSKRLLIVLGEPQLEQVLLSQLDRIGWVGGTAPSGQAALASLKDGGADAVLMSPTLPDMMAGTLVAQIREALGDQVPRLLLMTPPGLPRDLVESVAVDGLFDPKRGLNSLLDLLGTAERGGEKVVTPAPATTAAVEEPAPAATGAVATAPVIVPRVAGTRALPLPAEDRFRAGGTIEGEDIAAHIGALLRFEMTGHLLIEGDAVQRRIFVESGVPIFASSTAGGERLGEHLVAAGTISRGELNNALNAAAKGRKLGKILVSMGAVTETELGELVAGHVRTRMVDCLKAGGQYSFVEEEPSPPTRLAEPPKLLAILRDGIVAHMSPQVLANRLPGGAVLRPILPPPVLADACGLGSAISLDWLDGVAPVEAGLSTAADPGGLLAALYALYCGGTLVSA